MATSEAPEETLEYTPTWVVAAVAAIFIVISMLAERFLHCLGKILRKRQQDALYEALQKLKEELMILGFISLLLSVFQRTITRICVPAGFYKHMLQCKKKGFSDDDENESFNVCVSKGKIPLLSIEALHQLHIFIFVLAVVHVVFCTTTVVLGGAKIRKWKHWEDDIREGQQKKEKYEHSTHVHSQYEFVRNRAMGVWQRSVIVGWIRSFFKQFHASVTESDYRALRSGFIMRHCSSNQNFDFNKYMLRTLEDDFTIIVGISWYLWLFVVIFLLLNVGGWHAYFWLSFLPLVLLLAVGTKLERVITRLAQEAAEKLSDGQEALQVKPSDRHFWFNRPGIILYIIHFILFQNAFEIAFFFAIWTTYGFHSCIMEKLGYLVTRLVMGVLIQVLCSYSTLPLYTIVTQMGDMFKQAIFDEQLRSTLHDWAENVRKRKRPRAVGVSSLMNVFTSGGKKAESGSGVQMQKMNMEEDGSSSRAAEVSPALE